MRSRNYYLIFLSLFFAIPVSAQQVADWIVPVKTRYLFGNSVSRLPPPHVIPSSDGGVFLAGFHGSPFSFDLLLGTDELLATGDPTSRYYFAKVGPDGEAEWIKKISGKRVSAASPDDVPRGVSDNEGGLFVAAVVRSSIIFGNDTLTEVSDKRNLFIGHLTATGEMDDYRTIETDIYALDALEVTRNGDLVVTGRFRDFSLSFDQQTISSISSPSYFMARLTAAGEVKWVGSLPAEAKWRGVGDASGLVENDRGDLIMSIAPGGSNTSISGCASDPHFFVLAAFNGEDGSLRWQREIATHGFGYISDLAAAPNGDLYAVGGFGGRLTAANGESNQSTSPTTDCNELTGFLLKVTSEGMVYDHVPASQPNLVGHRIAFLSNGQYLISGRVTEREGLDPQTLPRGLVLQRFSASGELLSANSLSGSSLSSDGWMDLEVNARDDVFLTLPYSESLLGTTQSLTFPNQSCYVAKLTLPELTIPTPVLRPENITIFPNPTTKLLNINTPKGGAAEKAISLFDAVGRRVRHFPPARDRSQHVIDLSGLPRGIYLLKFGDFSRGPNRRIIKN